MQSAKEACFNKDEHDKNWRRLLSLKFENCEKVATSKTGENVKFGQIRES